jgi:intein-encoded DNA endonuclease-like protein
MSKKGIKLERILELYNQGLPQIQIAEKLGCTNSNIGRRLKKAGIIYKKNTSLIRHSRIGRYKVDEDYFETIDTEGKAYFLGLMYSDGSVSNAGFYLKMKDEDVIQLLKQELNAEMPIRRIEKPWDAYVIQIYSKKLRNHLINHGCVPNKTRVIQVPELREDLYRHFIRGFFDGDGCLQLQDKIYHCRFDLTSASKIFLEQIRPIITKHSRTNGYLGKEKKYEVWHLNFSGHQVVDILDWLYEDSNFYLKRKFVKYQILKQYQVRNKQGELLGSPEVDNQQPSLGSA